MVRAMARNGEVSSGAASGHQTIEDARRVRRLRPKEPGRRRASERMANLVARVLRRQARRHEDARAADGDELLRREATQTLAECLCAPVDQHARGAGWRPGFISLSPPSASAAPGKTRDHHRPHARRRFWARPRGVRGQHRSRGSLGVSGVGLAAAAQVAAHGPLHAPLTAIPAEPQVAGEPGAVAACALHAGATHGAEAFRPGASFIVAISRSSGRLAAEPRRPTRGHSGHRQRAGRGACRRPAPAPSTSGTRSSAQRPLSASRRHVRRPLSRLRWHCLPEDPEETDDTWVHATGEPLVRAHAPSPAGGYGTTPQGGADGSQLRRRHFRLSLRPGSGPPRGVARNQPSSVRSRV